MTQNRSARVVAALLAAAVCLAWLAAAACAPAQAEPLDVTYYYLPG